LGRGISLRCRIEAARYGTSAEASEIIVTIPAAPATRTAGGAEPPFPFCPSWLAAVDGHYSLTDEPFSRRTLTLNAQRRRWS